MQNNNFRGFSSNNRYNQSYGNSGFQSSFNQFNNQKNQNNLLFSNSNTNNTNNIYSFNNSQQNNHFPIRINPISNFPLNNSIPLRPNSQKKRLYVKLTQEEKGYFSNLFQLVDNDNIGKLKAKDAANFMKKSGLNKDTLKNIYYIASQSSKQFLERDEFYVALRLIALAQNNMPYNAQAIITNRPLPPLPNFNLKKDYLSDDDALFEMRDDEKTKYKRFFDINKDGNNDNISSRKAIQMWRSTGANDNIIKKVADILKPNETKGFLNLREFQVATHLINLSEKHELPTQLPNNLRKYLGRPENNNFNILNLNQNDKVNNNTNNNGFMEKKYQSIMSLQFENNNSNNEQQLAISYPKFNFGSINSFNNNFNNNFNANNNFNSNNNFNANNNINNNLNNNFNSNNNFNNSNNQNQMQKTLREIEELNQQNELISNQINIAKNKLNTVLREIDILQNEQQNIQNQINLMKQKCGIVMPNINININNDNNFNNNVKNNNNNNILNNNLNNNNSSANKYNNISLNQSGIGPNKSIIGFNLPQQQNKNQIQKDEKKEEYERLAKQRQNLMDLMNKMQFDTLMIKNDNNADKKEEEVKNNKDIIDNQPERDSSQKNISPLENDTNNNHNNEHINNFDDRLLESQAFAPEKLEKIVNEEIPDPGDDFNLGDEIVNPYTENKEKNKKKDDFNFEPSSPIEEKQFNFDRPSNVSLGSEIKKIDEDNGNINIGGEHSDKNKFKGNDSNMFNLEYGETDKKSKETFNFNTMDKQKDNDEWDF